MGPFQSNEYETKQGLRPTVQASAVCNSTGSIFVAIAKQLSQHCNKYDDLVILQEYYMNI